MGYLDQPYLGLHNEPYPELRPAPNKGWVKGLLDSVTPDVNTWRGIVGLLSNQSLRQRPPDVSTGEALKAVADATPIGPLIDAATQADELRRAREGGDSYGTGKSVGDLAKTVAMAFVPGSKGGKVAPIRGYHASPYNFDKFELRPGTGEGSAAYGHGLYVAENEAVSNRYHQLFKDTLGNQQTPAGAADRAMAMANGDRAKALAALENEVVSIRRAAEAMRAKGKTVPDIFLNRIEAEYLPAIEMVKGGFKPGGHRYEVGIHADPAKMLDWDRRLAEQSPEVQRAVRQTVERAQAEAAGGPFAMHGQVQGAAGTEIVSPDRLPQLSGAATTQMLQKVYGGPMQSERLREAGIPGIKYLDQGSRNTLDVLPQNPITDQARTLLRKTSNDADAAVAQLRELSKDFSSAERDQIEKVIRQSTKQGTSNYVVFDPAIIEIMRKYGIPIAAGGAAAATVPGLLNDNQTY